MNSEYTNIYGTSTKKGLKTSFDLSSVEKVSINGQDYLKFVNPETGEMELIENNSNDSLQTQFEKIRDYYSIKQSDDARKNTKTILDFKQKYDSQKVSFVKIEDMVNNYGDYERQLSSLNSSQMKVLNYLIVNRQDLKIDTINLEKGIALTTEGKVVEASIDPATLEISAKNAETTKFEYQNQSSFAPATNKEELNKETMYTDEQYMEYPELLEKQYNAGLITLEEKEAIEERIEQKKKENAQLTNNKQKQYVYKLEDKKAGFVDYVFYPFMIVVIGLLIIASIVIVAMI